MGREWLAMEHYRLHSVEAWPDSPRKEAAMTAIRSKLDSLARDPRVMTQPLDCQICANRKKAAVVRDFPQRPKDPLIQITEAA